MNNFRIFRYIGYRCNEIALLGMIFIWGFMGSGKSTIGKLLAKELHWEHFDLDDEISKNENCSISDIFGLEGEAYFRQCEKDVFLNLASSTNHIVVSCGGGTPMFNNMNKIMLKRGIVIYLECDKTVLQKRLVSSTNARPLLDGLSENEMVGKISKMIKIREKTYQMAHHTIGNDGHLRETIKLIINKLNIDK